MRVLYFSSNEYAMFAGISILSMLENNSDVEELEFFLLEDNISTQNKSKIKSIFDKYNKECHFLDANVCFQTIIQKYNMKDYNGGKTGWLRIFPDVIFPGYEGDVLYMDSDTIVNGSIKGLCHLEWGDKVITASNCSPIGTARLMKWFAGREEMEIIQQRGGQYFNSGIIIYNMKNFKEKKGRERMDYAMTGLKELVFIDQSVLNKAFGNDDVLNMEHKYNYYFHIEPKYSRFIERTGELEGIDMKPTVDAPVIVHYPGERPWFKESISRKAYLYEKYRDISPWKGTELSYWDSPQYRRLKLIDKIFEQIRRKIYHTRIYGYYSYLKDSKALRFAEKVKRNG